MRGIYKHNPSKWEEPLIKALDDFWMQNHYPPAVRDLMQATGITSTSVCIYVLSRLPNVRFTQYGKPIPKWVDAIFEEKKSETISQA